MNRCSTKGFTSLFIILNTDLFFFFIFDLVCSTKKKEETTPVPRQDEPMDEI